ncbi:MAG: PEP-CTERM sorting domain-containing protein [Rivularia sp. (in: Bacteria)]|nr:PEP-CTERM sorting domain-containing protein [Rivularia sp. MS3]
MRFTNILMLGSLIAIALPSFSARATEVNGSFDWNASGIEFLENGEKNPLFEGNTFSGSATFNFETEPFKTGDLTFTIEEFNNQVIPPTVEEFDITSANFSDNGELTSFVFSNPNDTDLFNGRVDFSNPTDSSKSFFFNDGELEALQPSNLNVTFNSKTVPEPSIIFGLTTVLARAAFLKKAKTKVI